MVTITSSLGSTAGHSGFLQVNLGPPSAIRLGGAWRVSPTNYGELKELRFYTNFMTNGLTLAVRSTNFTVEVKDLPGFITPTNSTITIVEGAKVPLDLFYTVLPPRLVFDRVAGIGIFGTPSTDYRIEATPELLSQPNWSPVTSATLSPVTNWIPGTATGGFGNQFYRAVWLPE